MKLELHDNVALLTMAHGKVNAMNAEWIDKMNDLLDEFDASGARALVLTGTGNIFSAGLDLPSLIDLDRAALKNYLDKFNAVMLRVFEIGKPVIAAINGHAIAGGCVLAQQADYRVMADGKFRIGLREIEVGVGLPTLVVESLRLAVPSSSLTPIALEARQLAAPEALQMGLIHEVSPPEELETRALAKARHLAGLPTVAYAQIKRTIRRPVLEAVKKNEAADTTGFMDCWYSQEGQTRLRATIAKLLGK